MVMMAQPIYVQLKYSRNFTKEILGIILQPWIHGALIKSLSKIWSYKIMWTGQIGKRSEKKHGCRLASLDGIVGGRGIASGHTAASREHDLHPCKAIIQI